MIDAAKLSRLKEVASKATQGQWRYIPSDDDCSPGVLAGSEASETMICWDTDSDDKIAANFTHIAAFDPPTVLELIEALERAQAERNAHRDAMNVMMTTWVTPRQFNVACEQRDSARALLKAISKMVSRISPASASPSNL